MPASRSACLATTLSMQRMQAPGPRGGVRDADQLEQLLDGPVLAAAAVQGDERDVRALGLQAVDEVGADVDRQHLVPEPRQRVLHPRAGAQRDRALQRGAALEHRDLHEASRRRSGTTFSRLGVAARA